MNCRSISKEENVGVIISEMPDLDLYSSTLNTPIIFSPNSSTTKRDSERLSKIGEKEAEERYRKRKENIENMLARKDRSNSKENKKSFQTLTRGLRRSNDSLKQSTKNNIELLDINGIQLVNSLSKFKSTITNHSLNNKPVKARPYLDSKDDQFLQLDGLLKEALSKTISLKSTPRNEHSMNRPRAFSSIKKLEGKEKPSKEIHKHSVTMRDRSVPNPRKYSEIHKTKQLNTKVTCKKVNVIRNKESREKKSIKEKLSSCIHELNPSKKKIEQKHSFFDYTFSKANASRVPGKILRRSTSIIVEKPLASIKSIESMIEYIL